MRVIYISVLPINTSIVTAHILSALTFLVNIYTVEGYDIKVRIVLCI